MNSMLRKHWDIKGRK